MIPISTNPPGYLKKYYKKERLKLFYMLGNACFMCGDRSNLEIHHLVPLGRKRPSGQLHRLTEWKKNPQNLMLLCKSCHRLIHRKIR